MRSRDPRPLSGGGGASPERVRGPRSGRQSPQRGGCGAARPQPQPRPQTQTPAPAPRGGAGPAPPGRYRPRLPRLCLGVSPPASWQRSLRHWKSNRNPAASLLLRSLAIARSLPRQLSGCGVRAAPRRWWGSPGGRRAALAGAEPPCARSRAHAVGRQGRAAGAGGAGPGLGGAVRRWGGLRAPNSRGRAALSPAASPLGKTSPASLRSAKLFPPRSLLIDSRRATEILPSWLAPTQLPSPAG